MNDVMKRIVQKDDKAFEELYDRFSGGLFVTILAMVKNREDAEEILHNTFIRVWKKAGTFDGERGSVWGWLLVLARNCSIDWLRTRDAKDQRLGRNDSETDLDGLANPDAEDPHDRMLRKQRVARVQSALESIAPEQRKVIEVAYLEGRSQSEVAERLHLPLGTVKTRMRAGMRTLKSLLGRKEP